MTVFIMLIHVLACILLATIILMQSGRGGGLTESFASAGESMFGAKTNSVLVKGTGILAGIFLVTCLSLAHLSAKQDRSLMSDRPAAAPITQTPPVNQAIPADPTVTNSVVADTADTVVETKEAAVETNPEPNPVPVPAPAPAGAAPGAQ